MVIFGHVAARGATQRSPCGRCGSLGPGRGLKPCGAQLSRHHACLNFDVITCLDHLCRTCMGRSRVRVVCGRERRHRSLFTNFHLRTSPEPFHPPVQHLQSIALNLSLNTSTVPLRRRAPVTQAVLARGTYRTSCWVRHSPARCPQGGGPAQSST